MNKKYDKAAAIIPTEPDASEGKAAPSGAAQNGGEYELSPEQQAQISNYVSGVMKMIHSPQVSDHIIASLGKRKPPQAAVAVTANMVHDLLVQKAESAGKKFNNIAMFYGSQSLVNELIELGESAGLWKMSDEDKAAALWLALQHYFGRGIKEGWIDPVALQRDVEPLVPEEYRNKWVSEGSKPQQTRVMARRDPNSNVVTDDGGMA